LAPHVVDSLTLVLFVNAYFKPVTRKLEHSDLTTGS